VLIGTRAAWRVCAASYFCGSPFGRLRSALSRKLTGTETYPSFSDALRKHRPVGQVYPRYPQLVPSNYRQ